MLDDGAQDRLLVLAADPVEDATGAQRFAETRNRRGVALGLVEDSGRDAHAP